MLKRALFSGALRKEPTGNIKEVNSLTKVSAHISVAKTNLPPFKNKTNP